MTSQKSGVQPLLFLSRTTFTPHSRGSAAAFEQSMFMAGRRAIIVIDDPDLCMERIVMPHVFHSVGAHPDSKPVTYPVFFLDTFSTKDQSADVIALRSSRIFTLRTDQLVSRLRQLKQSNPNSVIVVGFFDPNILPAVRPLADEGVVVLVANPQDDRVLLKIGTDVLDKK
ncbi:hypothetical protein HY988_07715 [Candidatus Micrarchaeota archaeon]|nr:hypothetical protein [Candidatus Micrarchaeota archaeon]